MSNVVFQMWPAKQAIILSIRLHCLHCIVLYCFTDGLQFVYRSDVYGTANMADYPNMSFSAIVPSLWRFFHLDLHIH